MAIDNSSNSSSFLRDDGTPNLPLLIETFNRCAPSIAGGTMWMDNVRFCRWPGQWPDGRKHTGEGTKATPWEGASDCRPFVVDDIINERVAMMCAAFWRAMVQPGGSGNESSNYAVALVEYLLFTRQAARFNDEVELSANYQEHYGWCMLAPRWRRELGLRPYEIKLADLQAGAQQAQQQLAAAQTQPGQPGQPADPASDPNQPDPTLLGLAQLPQMIIDPSQEDAAVEFLAQYYDQYVNANLPADLVDRAPQLTDAQVRKAVVALRTKSTATVAIPFVSKNEPEIAALKPWDEVFLPPELTTENEVVFQIERVTEAELKGRQLSDGYNPEWIKVALTKKGQWSVQTLPVGTPQGLSGMVGGNNGGSVIQTPGTPALDGKTGPIEIIHALYKAADENGIPQVYCTTFHRDILTATGGSGADLLAKNEPVESINGEMPYVAMVRERWSRSVVSSRSIPEMAFTQQNLVKGFLDALIDRQSITLLPPVNVYASPLEEDYQFGPARKNFVKPGREPQFMQMPAGNGAQEGLEVHNTIRTGLDNRFALLSPEVSQPRQQTAQEKSVRRFLICWTRAIQQMLVLYQKHGDDAEFARVTGADPGWLESNRNVAGLLDCALEFDVRELDPELMMKRIEAMNSVVLPNDVLGVVQRGAWATYMARAILGPAQAKQMVQPQDDASTQLQDKVRNEVIQMFAGNAPKFVDDKDPTAGAMLDMTKQIVLANPTYLRALNDQAIVALAGNNAPAVLQQLGNNRHPDDTFSGLLIQWLKNLQFVGVTQVQNKQVGRMGVKPQGPAN